MVSRSIPRSRGVRRRGAVVIAAVAVVVTLAGCASAVPRADAALPPPAHGDAVDLVGLWRVSGAEAESPDTWLRLDAGELHLWRECGPLLGSWQAGGGIITASTWGAAGECATDGVPPDVAWLAAATTYQRTDEGWEFRDRDGVPVASLREDGAPGTLPTIAEQYARAPVVTERTRAYFTEPPALPDPLIAADTSSLVGGWVPASGTASDAHAQFAPDGSWAGSDGCNGGTGRWVLGVDGAFLATAGVSTLIGCDGVPVPAWVASARLAGFDGHTLVLLDSTGSELGRLEPGAAR
ncbi:hypothetical protein NQ152_10315 [Microbacterium sp. zg.B48]|uniref:hypothetical protein n=1 Tax=unclassified Microbacterium TaxID=2609290 RepID=UPI00214B211A|nr:MULTISPECIES: hypothetical protein [unclassified Microbacterium]MCR2763897.1 hypothetical protein [Microbacterium sp. zg.B48]MCR2810319.1 hypothetical protein [Microbacterium sp. zg.B185]WIM18379.1 hypothetical protein QNO12_12325 [Microbacterium sp. zg-B185]